MEKQFIEYCTCLTNQLESINEYKWAKQIHKSIEIFIKDKSLNDFYSNFGGIGSISDNFFDPITEELLELTYLIANTIKNNNNYNINTILNNRLIKLKSYSKNNYYNQAATFIEYLINNYTEGNLELIINIYTNRIISKKI